MKRSLSGTVVRGVPSEKSTMDRAVLESLSKEELINRLLQASEESKRLLDDLKKEQKRENFATLRLAVKEKLTAELMEEVELLRKSCSEERKPDRVMMDCFTGQVFQAMRDKLRHFKKEVKLLKMELDAAKIKNDCPRVSKLARKCEKLEELNAESRTNAQKIARLEILLAYANKNIDKLRRRQRDVNELFLDQDAEVANLQSEVARLQEENRRLSERNEVDQENFAASRLRSGSRASTAISEQQEEGEYELVENNADEVESVSSREMLNEVKETLVAEEDEDEVVKVSSSGSEPDDAVVISSPEAEELE